MNRSKKIYTLLALLLVITILAVIAVTYQQKQEAIKTSDEIILEINSDQVTGLSWEYDGESLAFHKNDTWSYDEDEDFPVDEEQVASLLSVFSEFGVSFVIEDVTDYGQYGLENPTCTISIEAEDENYEILLGDFSTMDSQRYVSIGDGNVYLVQTDPMETFEITLSDMIQNDEFPQFDYAEQIEFTGEESYRIIYDESGKSSLCSEDVYFKDGEADKPLDTDLVSSYLTVLESLSLSDYMTYKAQDEDLSQYGLDSPELKIDINYVKSADEDAGTEEEKGSIALLVSRDPSEIEEDSEDEEDVTAYAMVEGSKIVYRLTADEYKALMAMDYDELRHQNIFTADFADVDKIVISLEDEKYTITSELEDEERIYSYKKEEVELDDFESALTSLSAEIFTDGKEDQKEEISMTFYFDNEEESKQTLTLYRYDGDSCIAAVDGEAVAIVERATVIELIEAVHTIVLNAD